MTPHSRKWMRGLIPAALALSLPLACLTPAHARVTRIVIDQTLLQGLSK